jgi:DNA-directed RNA polymerase specialized sigma24 family protein
MSLPSQLQFSLLPFEAQRAAFHRLALRGCDPATISTRTGVPESEIRRHLSEADVVPARAWRRAFQLRSQ